MRVLITGGAGFIGSWLSKELIKQNIEVVIFDNLSPQVHGVNGDFALFQKQNCFCIKGDIRDSELLSQAIDKVEYVVHLAAETGMGQSQYEIKKYFDVNVNGTANLLQILKTNPNNVKRIVLSSTGRIYGEGAHFCKKHGKIYPKFRDKNQLLQRRWEVYCPVCDEPMSPLLCSEDDLSLPSSMYSITKLTQENMLKLFGELYNFETVILRYQNVYGQGQSLKNPYTGVISVFCTRYKNKLPAEIFEDGFPTRDFIHVSDITRATIRSIFKEEISGKIINIGSGNPTSIIEVAKIIQHHFQSEHSPIITGDFRLGDIRNMTADIDNAKSILGFHPEIDISDGLKQVVDWALQQPNIDDTSHNALKEIKNNNLGSLL